MRIFAVVFLLFISSNLFAQDGWYPIITCGSCLPQHSSLFPVVEVVAKPIAFVDSMQIPLVIEGHDLGFKSYPLWRFLVVQHISGFCDKELILPVREEEWSLLSEAEVMLEIVKFKSMHFALITPKSKHSTLEIAKSIEQLEIEKMRVGKLLKIESIEKKFLLSEYGINPLLPDTVNYGYDTAQITDSYYRLKIQTGEKISYFYCRESEMLGKTIFEVGNTYLFVFHDNKGENWIEIEHLYQKNFHLNTYFEAYEKRD